MDLIRRETNSLVVVLDCAEELITENQKLVTFPNLKGVIIGLAFDFFLKKVAQNIQRYSFEFLH